MDKYKQKALNVILRPYSRIVRFLMSGIAEHFIIQVLRSCTYKSKEWVHVLTVTVKRKRNRVNKEIISVCLIIIA